MRLPINEVFETVQGEATWTGTPAVFLRVQQCPVGCPWCDTKHTWDLNPSEEVQRDAMQYKQADSPAYAWLDGGEIVGMLKSYRAKHVVITGGEPAMYDLSLLTERIAACGMRTQIETSGTFEINALGTAWVTVSPKVDMPGGRKVLASAMERANEVKFPVGKMADVERLKRLLDTTPPRPGTPIWLQPLSMSEKATALCTEAATVNDWRISLQTHKFLGVR